MNEPKIITVSTGEKIFVFDNFFTTVEQEYFFNFSTNSAYKLLYSQLDDFDYHFYGCRLTEDDLYNMSFLRNDNINKIENFVENSNIIRAWILSTVSSTKYKYHSDCGGKNNLLTLTYYLNLKWDKDWGGETIFCNNYGEPELVVEYKPNRLIIFPSKLPHKPSLHSSTKVRYSLSIVFEKE